MEKPFDHFADLESDFGDEFTARPASNQLGAALEDDGLIEASRQFSERTLKTTTKMRVEVKCESCRGTGKFVGYTGRVLGACFKCKGTGKILRAANYEQQKAKREAKKVEKANAHLLAVNEWLKAHPAEAQWMADHAARFDFARSMQEAVGKWAGLTEGQLTAVQKCMARDAERAAARKAEQEAPKQVGVNSFPRIEQLVRGKNLKLHLGSAKVVMFQSGAVAVVGPQFGTGTFGIIEQGGALRRFKAMTDETFTRLQAVEARGLEAVKEIGIATGRCCVCGRTLTDEGSIEAGIGPVCATRMEGF